MGKKVTAAKTARLEARLPPEIKDLIAHAAAVQGVEISAFVVNATAAAARDVLSSHAVTILASAPDREAFFAALNRPPAPSTRLIEAFRKRKAEVGEDG